MMVRLRSYFGFCALFLLAPLFSVFVVGVGVANATPVFHCAVTITSGTLNSSLPVWPASGADQVSVEYTETCQNVPSGNNGFGAVIVVSGHDYEFPIEQVTGGGSYGGMGSITVAYTGESGPNCTAFGSGSDCNSAPVNVLGDTYLANTPEQVGPPYATYTGVPFASTVLIGLGTGTGTGTATLTGGGTNIDCQLTTISGTAPMFGGKVYDYHPQFIGTAGIIAYAFLSGEPVWTSSPPGFEYSGGTVVEGKTFTNGAFVFVGPFSGGSDIEQLDMTDAPYTGYYAGLSWDVEAWCYSASTGWVDWGDMSSVSTTECTLMASCNPNTGPTTGDGTEGFPLEDCWANTGFGLNPSSWVPGLLKGAECILEWAFVPTSSEIMGVKDSLLGSLDTTIPFSYVAGGMTDVNAFVAAAGTSTSCSAPSIGFTNPSSGFFHDVNVGQFHVTLPSPASCGPSYALAGEGTYSANDYVGNLFGYQALIRNVLSFSVWLAFIAIAWGMMPWARARDGIGVLTNAYQSGLNVGLWGGDDTPKTDDGTDNDGSGDGAT